MIDDEAIHKIPSLIDLWRTNSTPDSNAGTADNADLCSDVGPSKNGTVFRFFEIPPEDLSISKEEQYEAAKMLFAELNASHLLVDTTKDPYMHKSNTTDYIILLEGSIRLLLDNEDVDLKPFDVVIQRGTNHAWVNKGTKTALLMEVLIDADNTH